MVPEYGPLIRNPTKPILTQSKTTYKTSVQASDFFQEGKRPYKGPIGNPLDYIRAHSQKGIKSLAEKPFTIRVRWGATL